jgi:hypothetical protein
MSILEGMAMFLTKKTLVIRLTIPFFTATAVLFLVMQLLSGPVLGAEYDFLTGRRHFPPVSQEILLIETGEKTNEHQNSIRTESSGTKETVISPTLASSVIITLTEMSASTLIIQAPILGVSSGGAVNEGELLYRFEEEFETINRNIKNLFDGIRLGSVAPGDAGRFVDELIQLNEGGEKRLLEATFETSETEVLVLEKAFDVFGGAYLPSDLAVSLISYTGDSVSNLSSLYSSGYSQSRADPDGKTRRIAPFIRHGNKESEHIVWRALKPRYKNKDFPLRLDKNGALLLEIPKEKLPFRSIPLSMFPEYDDLDKTLYRLLVEDVSLAPYSGIPADKYPAFLYEKAQQIRENLFEHNEKELKQRWIAGREEYFDALDVFFSDAVEKNIADSFDKLTQEEKFDKKNLEAFLLMRDNELQKYGIAKEIWLDLDRIRNRLEKSLLNSFCIMGISTDFSQSYEPASGTGISVLLANSILSAYSINPADEKYIALFSLIFACIVILIVLKLGPMLSFVVGIVCTVFIFGLFSYRFIISGYWFDPIIPALTAFSGALSSSLCIFITSRSRSIILKQTFGAIISAENLRKLIKVHKVLPQKSVVLCAIAAIRNPGLTLSAYRGNALITAQALNLFRNEVRAVFLKEDGVIVSETEDTILVCFGSPIERFIMEARGSPEHNTDNTVHETPVNKVARIIAELPKKNKKSAPWHFGLDYGECNFSWSPLAGYTVCGKTVVNARLLSGLCSQYKLKALVSNSAAAKLEPRRINEIQDKNNKGTVQEAFFELR